MTNIRRLPIGIQTFEKIIRNGYKYIDKTKFIRLLAGKNYCYFLSRPRRFGKSLFVSTLDAYFSGKKELFNGLAIAEDEPKMAEEEGRDEWIKYPVIYINFDDVDLQSFEVFLTTFAQKFDRVCNDFGANFSDIDSIPAKFENLMEFIYNKYNLPVIILIDEYDKPMLSEIDNPEVVERYTKFFKSFYGKLKGSDRYIKFAFITGMTKFSKVSIFSDLNNLNDISLDDEFADICGITKNELMTEFQPDIASMAEKNNLTYEECLARLKKHYDGYHFSSSLMDIYNPFSLLNAFSACRFGNYWFETGTPTFLIKAIHQSDFELHSFNDGIEVGINSINAYKLDFSNIIPMMYQSGYLTIKSYDLDYDTCILGYPNEEVRYAFMEQLALEYTYLTHDSSKLDGATFSKYVCKSET